MVKTSLDAEANSNVQHVRWHFSEGWLHDFKKPKHTTHTNAPQRHNTLQTMAIEVCEGQAAAAPQMAQGAAASSRIAAVLCVCARGGKFAAELDNIWRRNALSRSQAEIGTKHPFSVDFPILELSETTFVSTCSVHIPYCTRILFELRSMAYIGVPQTVA